MAGKRTMGNRGVLGRRRGLLGRRKGLLARRRTRLIRRRVIAGAVLRTAGRKAGYSVRRRLKKAVRRRRARRLLG
jgi:hypothetical protein